jgi:hypothetical protein
MANSDETELQCTLRFLFGCVAFVVACFIAAAVVCRIEGEDVFVK